METQWKPIPGWPTYEISSGGDVKNVTTGKLLRHVLRKGYHGVTLYSRDRFKTIRIHNYMVRVFTDNWDSTLQAAHLDGNKDNNSLENIALVTSRENNLHKLRHGTMPLGSKHHRAKLDEAKVREIKRLLKTKDSTWATLSNKKIAKMFGVCENTIRNIDAGLIWKEV